MLRNQSAMPLFVLALLPLLACVLIPEGTFGSYELLAGAVMAAAFVLCVLAGFAALLNRSRVKYEEEQ